MIETDLTNEPGLEVVEIWFPAGLPGFPQARSFELAPWGTADSPFSTLVSTEDADVGFVVVSPWVFYPEYEFDLDNGTAERLGLESADDAIVLCVVTLDERPEGATVNLLGPIVVNRVTREAVQAVLSRSEYNVKAPLARAG